MATNKIINIGIGVDLEPLKKGMKDGAILATNEGKKIADAAVKSGDAVDKSNQKATASVASLHKEFREAQKEASQLAAKYGLMNDVTQQSIQNASQAREKLTAFNAEINRSTTSTSTAISSGFNPLSNSIHQLTREMPAFTYSVQTGFMAIGNNLPILADAVSRVKQTNAELISQGKPVQSVLSQIAGSLFSWNSALSVGITLTTVYGKEIGAWVSSLTAGNEQTKIYIKLSEEVTKAIQSETTAIIQRNKQLGIQIYATQNGITTTEAELAQSKQRLSAMEQVYTLLKKTNDEKIRERGVKPGVTESMVMDDGTNMAKQMILSIRQNAVDAENLTIYKKRVDAQREMVSQLEKEAALQSTLSSIVTRKANVSATQIETIHDPDLKRSIAASQKYIQDQFKKSKLEVKPLIKIDPRVIYDGSWKALMEAKFKADLASLRESLTSSIHGAIAGSFAMVGTWAAESAMGSYKDPFDALGQLLLSSMGNLMVQMGTEMVTMGLGMTAFQASLAALQPAGMIAAGAVMAAAGAAISTLAQKGLQRNTVSGGSDGSVSGGTSGKVPSPVYSNSGSSSNPVMSTRMYGRDQLLIIDQQGRIKRR